MPIKTRSFFFGILLISAIGAAQCLQAKVDASQQRLAAGYLLTFGEPLASSAFPEDAAAVFTSVAEAHSSFNQTLTEHAEGRQAVAGRAFLDAFGISADAEGAPSPKRWDGEHSYIRQLEAHTSWLQQEPEVYRAVIERAYQWVVHREAYEEEIAYWQAHPEMPFILLVAGIEDWARRNQPGLMVTTGTATVSVNCDYLSALPLSPALAAEARDAVGLAAPVTEGHYVIAPGASTLASSGNIHFIPVGSPVLREGIRSPR